MIRKISKKRSAQVRTYSKIRKEFLEENPYCQARIPECTIQATQVHHKAGREGDRLNDTSRFLAVCDSCHKWIELNPLKAKEQGYSLSRLIS